MDFIRVINALKTIKKHCEETPNCKGCRLHSKEDDTSCGVSPSDNIPACWEFDEEAAETIPSIFK